MVMLIFFACLLYITAEINALVFDDNALQFNRHLDGRYTLLSVSGISISECWLMCEQRASCLSINYKQLEHHCVLNTAKVDTATGIHLSVVKGSAYRQKLVPSCGVLGCSENTACSSEGDVDSCSVQECKPIEDTVGRLIEGNMLTVGSAVLIQCINGFIPSTGSSFSVTSYCDKHGTWSPMLDCIQAGTCKGLADTGIRKSASYLLYDNGSHSNISMFCDFNNNSGIGYSYISKQSLGHVTDIATHYTVLDHVMIRISRTTRVYQYESKIAILSTYRKKYNVSIFIDEYPGFQLQTTYGDNGPYMYLGLVPIRVGEINGTRQGYACFNKDLTFINCDDNRNNYFAIFANALNGTYMNSGAVSSGIGIQWKYCSKPVDDDDRSLPEEYLFNVYTIHMGGCGAHVQSNADNVNGLAFGLPFEY